MDQNNRTEKLVEEVVSVRLQMKSSVVLVGIYIPPQYNTAISKLYQYISTVENSYPDMTDMLGDNRLGGSHLP